MLKKEQVINAHCLKLLNSYFLIVFECNIIRYNFIKNN